MLINIQDQIRDANIVELLGYSVFPDPEQIEVAIESYDFNHHFLYGYVVDNEVIGVIGYCLLSDNDVLIKHLSVKPEYRGLGYGRGMILEIIDLIRPKRITLETDDDAVDFYRNIGFEITSLGEKYPNVERYKCEFVTDFA